MFSTHALAVNKQTTPTPTCPVAKIGSTRFGYDHGLNWLTIKPIGLLDHIDCGAVPIEHSLRSQGLYISVTQSVTIIMCSN